MIEDDLLKEFNKKNIVEKKLLIRNLIELASNIDFGNLNSPIGWMDRKSDKNLEKKYFFLCRFLLKRNISKEELKDKRVFELLPDDDRNLTVN